MKVVELKIRDEEGQINYLRQTIIDKNRLVSLLSKRIRHLINEEELEGLCQIRFYEDITIEGLDAKKTSIGESLRIGEVILEVTSIGKRCFEKCKLIQAGEECDLFMNIVFTKIIKNGYVRIDDEVVNISPDDRIKSLYGECEEL